MIDFITSFFFSQNMNKFIILILLVLVSGCKQKNDSISGIYTCISGSSGYPANYNFKGNTLKISGQDQDSKFEYLPNNEVKEDGRSYYDTVKIDGASYFFEYVNESSFNLKLNIDEQKPDDINCGPKMNDSELKKEQDKINQQLRDQM